MNDPPSVLRCTDSLEMVSAISTIAGLEITQFFNRQVDNAQIFESLAWD